MKKSFALPFLAVLFAGLLCISSCKKEDLVVPYNFGDQPICLEVDPYQSVRVHTFSITNAQMLSILNAAGVTDLSKVKKATLKQGFKAVITTAGTATNLDELEGMQVYMKETGATDDGVQIAYTDVITPGSTETEFKLHGTNLIDAVTKDVTFTVKITNKVAGNSKKACIVLSQGTIEVAVKQ